jgi:hypothetical protein
MHCEYHWERTGVEVPVYRMGMCRDCFRGRPIKKSELRNVDSRPLPVRWDTAGNIILPGTRAEQPQSGHDEND